MLLAVIIFILMYYVFKILYLLVKVLKDNFQVVPLYLRDNCFERIYQHFRNSEIVLRISVFSIDLYFGFEEQNYL
jgi:hypothetical protein